MRELSLSVLDLIQNSADAGADFIEIFISEDTAGNKLLISVRDNGSGMDSESCSCVSNPFFTTRHGHAAGLGVPLFRQRALLTGGSFDINSKPGAGTKVSAVFCTDSVDSVPLGDIEGVIKYACTLKNTKVVFKFDKDGEQYTFETGTGQMKKKKV